MRTHPYFFIKFKSLSALVARFLNLAALFINSNPYAVLFFDALSLSLTLVLFS